MDLQKPEPETPEATDPTQSLNSLEEESPANLVSRVAQSSRQRQESTQREAQRERPPFILDIERSEVAYTLSPKFLPLAHIDYEAFIKLLEQKWSLSLDVSSVKLDPTILQRIAGEGHSTDDALGGAIVRHALQTGKPELSFIKGRYPLPKSEFVEIPAVTLNFETVLVSVSGISQIAEAVAQEIVELVNATAGADRRWEAVSGEVQVVGYATRTKVNLGSEAAFEHLLSPTLLTFIENHVESGEQFGAHAGGYYARNQLAPAPKPIVSVGLDDLTLRISNYDDVTGQVRQSDLRFSVMSRSDLRSGRVSISSELPYDVHEACIEALIQTLGDD
jgi:hypothetical protein